MSWSEPLEPLRRTQFDPELLGDDGDGRQWWVAVVLGLLMVGLGVWMLTNLVESVIVLAVIIGVSLVTGGLIDGFVLDDRPGPRWGAWIEGLLLVLAGIVVLTWPDITLWVLAFTGGLALVLGGAFHLVMSLVHRQSPGWALDLGLGVLGIVLGLVVLAWPGATLVVLAVLFGIRAIVVGVIAVVAGWRLRHRTTDVASAV